MCSKNTSNFLTHLSRKVKNIIIFTLVFGVFLLSLAPLTSVFAKPKEKPIKKTEHTEHYIPKTEQKPIQKTPTQTNTNTKTNTKTPSHTVTPINPTPQNTTKAPTQNQKTPQKTTQTQPTNQQGTATSAQNQTQNHPQAQTQSPETTTPDDQNSPTTNPSTNPANNPNSTTNSTEDPTTNPSESSENDTIEDSTPKNKGCSDLISGIGWLICPIIDITSKGVDSMYQIISDFLHVKPISTDQKSSIFILWQYFRDVTNIVFIIFFLVIIYSQITGIGFNNYQIKRTLPRIIVAAILINLSFLICSLAIDASNIIGASLKDFFSSIESKIIADSPKNMENFQWGSFAATVIIGGAATFAGITLSGGLLTVLWLFLPVLFGAIVAVAAGLLTIAARQAVIFLLVAVSPLAFVAYLLPNTERYFRQWKTILGQMLTFYPIFSLLFGASSLAGWAIISSSNNIYGMVLGMAIRVFPLFYSVKLMKMSGTALSSLNDIIQKRADKLSHAADNFANLHAAKARANYYNRAAVNRRFPDNKVLDRMEQFRNLGSRLYRTSENYKKALELSAKRAEEDKNDYQAMYQNDRELGRTIIGYGKDGKPIYKKDSRKVTREMQEAYRHKVIHTQLNASSKTLEKEFGAMGEFLEHGGFDKNDRRFKAMQNLKNQNLEAFLDLHNQQQSIASNEKADARDLHKKISDAAKRDENGNLLDRASYDKFVTAAAGYDALNADENIRNAALTKVIASSYEAADAERKANIQKYTNYAKEQVTPEVQRLYKGFIENKNAEGIVALGIELRNRGDLNLVSKPLAEALDNGDYLELGTEFSNQIAHLFMDMKGVSPAMARFGKHIMVETTRYVNGGRTDEDKYVTMKEYFTGETLAGHKTKGNAAAYLAGTPFKDIDRTAYDDLVQYVEEYLTNDPAGRDAIYKAILPQMISALPTFASGSEQIVNTMSHITGVKKKNGAWIESGSSAIDVDEYTSRTKTLLNSLVANDIINMKSDTIESVLNKFKLDAKRQNPTLTDAQAEAIAEETYVNSFNPDSLTVMNSTPNIAGIKPKNKDIFTRHGLLP